MLGRARARGFTLLTLLAVVWLVASCRPAPAPPTGAATAVPSAAVMPTHASRWSYEVELSADAAQLSVKLCIAGPMPNRLVLSAGAIDDLGEVRDATGASVPTTADIVNSAGLADGSCLDYMVDLLEHSNVGDWPPGGDANTRDFVGDPRTWLLRPPASDADIDVTLHLAPLPQGVHFSTPWRRVDDPATDGSTSYTLDITAFRWRGAIAFVRNPPIEFEAAGSRFSVAVLSGERASSDHGLHRWLTVSAETVAQLYGSYPRERLHIVVLPIAAPMSSPVIFGMVWRGGAPTAVLRLNAHAKDEQLIGEWMAIHELLHPGLPPMQIGDAWLFEGFVTYYTTVLRARAGLHRDTAGHFADAQEQQRLALVDLHEGFERGRGRSDEPTLAESSLTMRRTHAYQRVYWGGAAMALDIDMQLRRASGGQRSLDDLMRALHECCGTDPYQWSADDLLIEAEEIVSSWDSVAGEVSVAEIARRHLAGSRLPDAQMQFRGLAVERGRGGFQLGDRPEGDAQLRRAIFAPKRPNSRVLH